MNSPPRAPQARREEIECVEPERDRLLEALAGLEEVVYSMSPDARSIYFIRDACERLYARPASEFFANPTLWTEIIHPQDRARVMEGLNRLLAGVSFDDEYRILRPDGYDPLGARSREHGRGRSVGTVSLCSTTRPISWRWCGVSKK